MWSGRQDSNLRPPAPKAGALAKLSYAPVLLPCQIGIAQSQLRQGEMTSSTLTYIVVEVGRQRCGAHPGM